MRYTEILKSVQLLYCAVLRCTVLYCTVLYCTVLYCTVLYCTVLYCTVLTVLYCPLRRVDADQNLCNTKDIYFIFPHT